MNMCFIISSPRSGSTWVKRALNEHPEIFCTENRLFGSFFEVWPNNDGTKSPRITLDEYVRLFSLTSDWRVLGLSREDFNDLILSSYIKTLLQQLRKLSGKSVIVDKITPYFNTTHIVLERIKRFLPRAKIVHLIRDGRDVLTSGVFNWMIRRDDGKRRYARFVEGHSNVTCDRFFEDEDIDHWAQKWKGTVSEVSRSGAVALTITYEEMLDDQAGTLRRLFHMLNVDAATPLISRCVAAGRFENMSGGRSRGIHYPTHGVRMGVAGDWRRYFTRRDGELFNQCAGDILLARGYELDDSWIASLPTRLELLDHERL